MFILFYLAAHFYRSVMSYAELILWFAGFFRDVALHLRKSWQVRDKDGLFYSLFKSGSSPVDGQAYAASDLCVSSVTFCCVHPPQGFTGEVTFSLSGAEYHQKGDSLKSMDSTCCWPGESDPYFGPVVKLFWNTKPVHSCNTTANSRVSTLTGDCSLGSSYSNEPLVPISQPSTLTSHASRLAVLRKTLRAQPLTPKT
jgi:hypothetical protein